jgi:hypothetical protein
MLQVFECSMASRGMNCDIVYFTTVCGALEACQAILEGGGGRFDAKRIQLHHFPVPRFELFGFRGFWISHICYILISLVHTLQTRGTLGTVLTSLSPFSRPRCGGAVFVHRRDDSIQRMFAGIVAGIVCSLASRSNCAGQLTAPNSQTSAIPLVRGVGFAGTA